jgi:hypothetical protein
MKKTHDYIHYYRGYWSDGGRCRIRIHQEGGRAPVVICTQLPDNDNTSVTNMAEYLAAEVIGVHGLTTPLVWVEHYPEHEGEIGEYSLVRFSSWNPQEVCIGGVWRGKSGSPRWSPMDLEEVDMCCEAGKVSVKWKQTRELRDRGLSVADLLVRYEVFCRLAKEHRTYPGQSVSGLRGA